MRILPENVWRKIMDDYLQRERSPLTADGWAQVDQVVSAVVSTLPVGRRFISMSGPTRPGIQAVPAAGPKARPAAGPGAEPPIELPIIHWDFTIGRAEVRNGAPESLAPVADAAAVCGMAEDHLILHGHPQLGLAGLLTVPGRLQLMLADPGELVRDVLRAVRQLQEHGSRGPFALVLSPGLAGAIPNPEALEQVCTAGIHATGLMPEPRAVVVSADPAELDLAAPQDMVTAYLESDPAGHRFRVFEILALRIKRPEAICTLEPAVPA